MDAAFTSKPLTGAGFATGTTPAPAASAPTASAAPGPMAVPGELDLEAVFRDSHIADVLDELDTQLVGLVPVKSRIRDIAALLLVEKLRRRVGLETGPPSLHMSFTGNAGTGKTTVPVRRAEILHRLGYVREGVLTAVTGVGLVGEGVGHPASKSRDVLKRAVGG